MLSCPKARKVVEFAYYKEELIAVVVEPISPPEQPGNLLLVPTATLPWATYSSPIHLDQILQVCLQPPAQILSLCIASSVRAPVQWAVVHAAAVHAFITVLAVPCLDV